MLLRSLTKHVRDQNWFAVALDFFIVVAGILIAFQITNWNAARADRNAEAALLARLHLDVETAQSRLDDFAERRRTRFEHLRRVGDMFFGDEAVRPLTEDECTAVVTSYIISYPPASVPTLKEILAGGQISLIKSDQIRSAVLQLEQADDRARTVLDALNAQNIELARLHPHLFKVSVRPDYNHAGGLIFAICDRQKMIEDQNFLNDFSNSVNRNSGYIRIMIDPLVDALANMHGVLDATLAVSHTEEVAPK